MMILRFVICSVLLIGCLALTPKEGRADALYTVTLNTAPLVGSTSGPFAIGFQLTNGNTAPNIVTLSNFAFGGGAPLSIPTLVGGSSGDLSSQVTLTDSVFLNDFVQQFTPGSSLRFDLALTTNVAPGLFPDLFSFTLLDRTLMEVPTLGVGDALLSVEITSGGTLVQAFRTDLARTTINLSAPQVEAIQVEPIPEPSTLLLLGTGLVGVVSKVRRRIWLR